jgi:thiol-disulfide isomerase/thioredoxin
MTAFVVKAQLQIVPDIAFLDGAGQQRAISQWRGRVVLVNLWATWCAPCRKEMPALANLQRKLGGEHFEVVAISVDRKGAEGSAAFLAETGATSLALYVDRSAKVLDELQARGLPATLLIDREGREIGRLLGPAQWDSEDAVRLIEQAIGKPKGQTS